jgi:glycosyltransferase involved in cell wall biosynthesis
MLSVVIPTFNEIQNNILEDILKLLSGSKDIEVLCVDSFSTDGTKELIEKYQAKLIQVETNSRAKRLNIGIKSATGDMILLHHPRSLLTADGLRYLVTHAAELKWGAFTHKFDTTHPLLAFTSWWSNYGRGELRSIYYLDHCIFVKKSIIEKVGYIPEVDIFEDTEISLKLRKIARPTRLNFPATTLAIRFTKNGIWKQAILNQKLKWKFYYKTNHKEMNKDYEQGLELNSKYKIENKNE